MAAFNRVIGKKISPLAADWLTETINEYDQVLIDVGTGDGRFIIDTARENPGWLCIGIDAAAENMVKLSRNAAAKPKKGGLANAHFVRGAAEHLPGLFTAVADFVTINYPWGSLMKIVSEPQMAHLQRIRDICKTGAELSILLNYYVFDDDEYLQRLGLGDIEKPAESEKLVGCFEKAGFRIERRELFEGDPPIRTKWGRHLIRGSNRLTLSIDAIAT